MSERLTRDQVREALESHSLDRVLLAKGSLTSQQRKLAKELATKSTKKEAIQAAGYSTKTGYKAAQHPAVKRLEEAYRLAAEAQHIQTPAKIRQVVINELLNLSLDRRCPYSSRIRALELLGKVTEVAAFTERSETITHTDSTTARQQIIDRLKALDITDITPDDDSQNLSADGSGLENTEKTPANDS